MKHKMNFMSKIVVGLAVLAVFAMAPLTASAVEYRLNDFMILVDDQLIIKGAADVTSFQGGIFQGTQMRSDLGSRVFAQIGGRLRARIPVEAPTLADVAVIAPDVTLGNFASVSHVIGTINDVGTSGRQGPTLAEPDICNNTLNDTGGVDCLPDFPSFPTFVPGTDDVEVLTSGLIRIGGVDQPPGPLPPGDYRDLLLGFRARINFQSGIYNFRRVIENVAGSYNLIFEDDTEIRVKQFVRLAEYGNVNPTGARNVIIYVEGSDGDYGGANRNQDGVYAEPAAFEYDGDGILSLCFVFVPNGTINLRGKSKAPVATQWLGKSFQEISSLRISMQQAIESCIPGGIECACITDFTLRSDGTLRVKGINLSEDTVGKLAIFTQAYSAALAGVSGGDAGADQDAVNLDFVSLDRFNTVNDIQSLLVPGNYFLGIIYPLNALLDVPGYCILLDKELEIPIP